MVWCGLGWHFLWITCKISFHFLGWWDCLVGGRYYVYRYEREGPCTSPTQHVHSEQNCTKWHFPHPYSYHTKWLLPVVAHFIRNLPISSLLCVCSWSMLIRYQFQWQWHPKWLAVLQSCHEICFRCCFGLLWHTCDKNDICDKYFLHFLV